MAIVYKSIKERYDDSAGKWIAGTDNIKNGIIAVAQNTSGATNQSTTVEVLLASNLDNMGTSNVLAFNPMAGSVPVANSDNTKAYGVRPVDLGQESVGIRKVGSQLVTIPKEVCDVSKDFTILKFVKIDELRANDATSVIANKINGVALEFNSSGTLRLFFGDASGTGAQAGITIDTGFSTKYKNKQILVYIIKSGLNASLYINNILVKSSTIEAVGNNSNNYIDSFGGISNVTDTLARFFNYAFSQADRDYYWNNGRPDLALVRDSDKWGSKTKYNSTYAGNQVLDLVAWYNGNTTSLMPVGLKRPNAIGLYDMSGNVWEWCWDRHGETYPTSTNNPTGASSGSFRVYRGGSWYYDGNCCMVSYRFNCSSPSSRSLDIGFRLCRKYSDTLLPNDVVVQAKLAGMQEIGAGAYTDCTTDSFLMQKYVVTVKEFSGSGTDTKPKVDVSWYESCKYANLKSSANSLDKCYHVAGNYDESSWDSPPAIECDFAKSGYRLPTEAEWEWAARQGSAGSVADYSPASIADPALITGAITSVVGGNTYQVVSELSTTDRDTIGAPDIAVGTRFVATNATAYTITSGKVQLIAVTIWKNNSTNSDLDATVSGNPMLVKTKVEEKQGQGVIDTVMQKITTSASINKILCTIPAGWRVDDISLDRTTQPSSNVTFSVGTTTTGTNIVNSYVYDRTFTSDTLYPMLRKYFSKETSQDIYISAVNWYSGVFNFTITLRRV